MRTVPDFASKPTHHQMLLGGEWVDALGGDSYIINSPATGTACAHVPSAGPDDVDRAVATALAAFRRHETTSAFQRSAWCHRVAEEIDTRTDEIALELAIEHGKPTADAVGEVASAAAGFRLAAEEVKRLGGTTIPVEDPNKRVMTIRRAKGVFAVITPWNFPINIPVEYLGPALATGNAVVWKPAPTTSRVAIRLAECIEAAGVPAGLLNMVTGGSVPMAQRLVSHPDVVGVGFTGSSQVGALIAASAAGKHLLLELGGNGPVIVLNDADLSRAVPAIGQAAFWNAGQSCAAAERIIAEPGIYDDLVAGLTEYAKNLAVGEPWENTSLMGPVNNGAVATKMREHIDDAVARGAIVTYGGTVIDGMPSELYLAPTVLRDVDRASLVQVEETFGPIAPITVADGDEDILALTNSSPLGLSVAVFAADVSRALRLAERIPAGQVVINDTSNYWELHMPFGGWAGKNSGQGRIGGRWTLEAMTEVQSISLNLG
jgi:acyl-CoA reductase-like NAD-dependent aldehyde dehydrogenase